jgi:hypothetical protein
MNKKFFIKKEKVAFLDIVTRSGTFNLFTIEQETFFSIRLIEHLKLRKVLSDKGKEGANRRWGNGGGNGGGNANKRNEINQITNKVSI